MLIDGFWSRESIFFWVVVCRKLIKFWYLISLKHKDLSLEELSLRYHFIEWVEYECAFLIFTCFWIFSLKINSPLTSICAAHVHVCQGSSTSLINFLHTMQNFFKGFQLQCNTIVIDLKNSKFQVFNSETLESIIL